MMLTPLAGQLSPLGSARGKIPYWRKVLNVAPASLIAYWQLNETSGTTAVDSSGNGLDGTYSGVTLNSTTFEDGTPAGSWDGINDIVAVWSSGLSSAFNHSAGTLLVWSYAPTGYTTSAAIARFSTGSGTSGAVRIDNNSGDWVAPSGSLSVSYTRAADRWQPTVVTWDTTLSLFVDGSLVGATGALGAWSGLSSQYTAIGANNSFNFANAFSGSIAHVALFNTPLDATQIANLAIV